MDLLKSEVGSSNNTCGTSALDGNSVASIDAEMVSRAIEEEEDQDQTTNPSIKTEPIESSMAVNHMDLLKGEFGSSNKTCGTSTLDGNSVVSIEAEMVSHVIEEEEDQDQTTIPAIKTEPIESSMPVNCVGFVEGQTCSCNEADVERDVGETEEFSFKVEEDIKEDVSIKVEDAIDIKDERPEAITFATIKTEQEDTVNEQLNLCEAECSYSCDICTELHGFTER
jgi:hypothetical protein